MMKFVFSGQSQPPTDAASRVKLVNGHVGNEKFWKTK
jgi:hypothetical protein